MINLDDGLILIGPGSEWFWTAFQGVVVGISLLGLLRQLRLQTAQHTREDVAALNAQWASERFLRYRLVVAIAQRDGTPPEEIPRGGPVAIGNFFEDVAAFTKTKYLNKKPVVGLMGVEVYWTWDALQPFVQLMRQVNGSNVWEDWEWLANEVLRLDPEVTMSTQPSTYAQRVANLEGLLAIETELRH